MLSRGFHCSSTSLFVKVGCKKVYLLVPYGVLLGLLVPDGVLLTLLVRRLRVVLVVLGVCTVQALYQDNNKVSCR